MKTSEADILIDPGKKGYSENHGQTSWENNLKTARRVQMGDWNKTVFEEWCEKLSKKPKGEWTGDEAGSYAKHCVL